MFDQGYNSDRQPGPFFDVEYIEDNQHVYEDALPDVVPLDSGEKFF